MQNFDYQRRDYVKVMKMVYNNTVGVHVEKKDLQLVIEELLEVNDWEMTLDYLCSVLVIKRVDITQMAEQIRGQTRKGKARWSADRYVSFLTTLCPVIFGYSFLEIQKKTRKREILQCRQYLQWYVKSVSKLSLSQIGAITGGKDHATVLHSKRTVDNLICTDKIFKEDVMDYLFHSDDELLREKVKKMKLENIPKKSNKNSDRGVIKFR
jgi:chromosomal replication initiation ATPase DnaA